MYACMCVCVLIDLMIAAMEDNYIPLNIYIYVCVCVCIDRPDDCSHGR